MVELPEGTIEYGNNADPYSDMVYGFVHEDGRYMFVSNTGSDKPDKKILISLAQLLSYSARTIFDKALEEGVAIDDLRPLTEAMADGIAEDMQSAAKGELASDFGDNNADIVIRQDGSLSFSFMEDDYADVALLHGAYACYEAILAIFYALGDCPDAYMAMPEIVSVFKGLPR